MYRREFVIGMVMASLTLVPWQTAKADRPILDADTLKLVLRAPSDADKAWIDYTVDMVQRGVLSADLFNSTFRWAKKRKINASIISNKL